MESFFALIVGTISVAAIHALAPDHWLPFVMIGRARNWSKKKLSFIAAVASFAHVGSSVVLGGLGILLGMASIELEGIEATRGGIGVLLLIGFGIAYALWGLKRARNHSHHAHSFDLSPKKVVTVWTLFGVFVLGPCEPLIPLMFLATSYGWSGIATTAAVFGIITLVMMVGQSLLAYAGIQLIPHRAAEKYSHALAGATIAVTGVFLLIV